MRGIFQAGETRSMPVNLVEKCARGSVSEYPGFTLGEQSSKASSSVERKISDMNTLFHFRDMLCMTSKDSR